MTSIVIDEVVIPFTSRLYSHRSSWPRTQFCMLQDAGFDVELGFGDEKKLVENDHWYVSHGMEFKGTYNLNGGFSQRIADRLKIMIDKPNGSITSLEIPMPDLTKLLEPRARGTEFDLSPSEWAELSNVCDTADIMTHREMLPCGVIERVVLGDSHSVARYETNTLVLRNDGLTMHGLLSRGIKSYLDAENLTKIKHLVISVGNIDIRHHLMRQVDPQKSISEMLVEMRKQLNELEEAGVVESFEVTAPYPVEFEGRKLPKTGYYKGTPFFGSWNDRALLVEYMTNIMALTFGNVYYWPREWFQMDPEKYADTFMEKPRSVHLSPAFYPWDLERNERRGEGS